jgi:hypothetical protein
MQISATPQKNLPQTLKKQDKSAQLRFGFTENIQHLVEQIPTSGPIAAAYFMGGIGVGLYFFIRAMKKVQKKIDIKLDEMDARDRQKQEDWFNKHDAPGSKRD